MVQFVEILIGLSSGIVVGAVYIALLIVLGVVPRLIQFAHASSNLQKIASAMTLGILVGTFFSFAAIVYSFSHFVSIMWGFIHGMFNGILIAALAETLNVFPILAKRLQLERYLFLLLVAIIGGKVIGSLFQWLFLIQQ